MATQDPNEEPQVADPSVNADDLMKATEGNTVETENGPEVATGDEVPPEQVTPAAGGENVSVPSAAGPAGPPSAGEGAVTADEADNVSPTPGANTAGTPQSQLDQAPPMADESGSNIPAPNLTQPPIEGALPEKTFDPSEALDPALTNPDKAAVERVEGRTSDAASRDAGTHIDEVPPDLNEGVKPSDGGPERYPFPQGGDVEIATIPEYTGDQEYWPALTVEDTVILGEHDSIPERLQGRRAFVTDAPRYLVPKGQESRVWITVKTRDEVNATLTVPLDAVEIQRGGKDSTVRG